MRRAGAQAWRGGTYSRALLYAGAERRRPEEAHRPPDMKVENPVGQRGNDLEEELVTVAVMEARLEAARPDLAREFEEKLASMAPGASSGGELLTAKVRSVVAHLTEAPTNWCARSSLHTRACADAKVVAGTR